MMRKCKNTKTASAQRQRPVLSLFVLTSYFLHQTSFLPVTQDFGMTMKVSLTR